MEYTEAQKLRLAELKADQIEAMRQMSNAKRGRAIIAGLECRLGDMEQFTREADALDAEIAVMEGE